MADLIKCLRCSFRGAQTDFPRKLNLQYLKTCTTYNTKQNKSAGKKRATKENENPSKKKRRGLGKDKSIGLGKLARTLESTRGGERVSVLGRTRTRIQCILIRFRIYRR
ncbi:hypothetical protein L208DRAFT_255588 [Tricholoma matsutake]|nr:hypothetical protein L208DRAFT_255588 [Tricholoma matsutake 945]